MAWVRIDDGFAQHPKLAKAGPLAMAMQIAALCYCNRNLTDGFVPRSVARTLLDWETVSGGVVYTIAITSGHQGDDVSSEWVISLLLGAGIWSEQDGGFRIHDYEKYQPIRADVLAEREKASERMKRARSPELRPNIAGSSPNPVPDPVPLSKNKKEKEDAPEAVRAETLPPETPPDPRKAIFDDGLRWLASSTGRPERALRPLVGKWIKARGDPEVAAAFVAAQQASPVDPISWIEARLKSNEQRKPSDLQRRRSLAEAFLSVGVGGDDDDPAPVGEAVPRLPFRASG